MTTEKLIPDTAETKDLLALLDETSNELLQLVSYCNETTINMVPFEDSWTAAQVAVHITKSNTGIAQALSMEGKPAERNSDVRVQELKAMFLDFTAKFQSPEFILPTENTYKKETLITDLKKSIEQLKEAGNNVNLSEIISIPLFGDITKFELLYLILYHTQRHIHQLKNIFKILENK